ncbi:MAG: MauE/DoxX family redox-associated membrane protein, partial [Actinomycetota bacterium]
LPSVTVAVSRPGGQLEIIMWLALDIVARLAVGGILFSAGAAKLASAATWRQLWLAAYRLLPRPLVRPAAMLLPTVEITVGAALLAGASAAFAAAAALLAVLALAVTTALLRQLEISCGCTGRLGGRVSWRVVLRNLVLIALVALPAWHGPGHALAVTGLPWPVQLTAVVLAVAAVHAGYAAARARQRSTFLAGVGQRAA